MGCKKEVSLLDLETFLTPETFDTFQKQQFRFVVERNAQNFISCPTTFVICVLCANLNRDCDYICFYDPNDAGEFGCPVCNKKYDTSRSADAVTDTVSVVEWSTMKEIPASNIKNGLNKMGAQINPSQRWQEVPDGSNAPIAMCG